MNEEVLGPDALPRPMSMAEWADLPEDEAGELVDGQLVEEEVPTILHEMIIVWLSSALLAWLGPRGGLVVGSEAKLAISPRRGRKPDLSAWLPGRRPPIRASVTNVPPDIVVEVVSPSPRDERRDRVEKVADYAAFGVRYYWLLDPELRTLEVLELGPDGRYVHALGVSGDRLQSIPGCPGLELDLDVLWAEVDRLSATQQ